MSVEIVEVFEDSESESIESMLIETVDATGEKRVYRAGLGPNLIGSEYLVEYRQIYGPEGSRAHTTDAVSEAAKAYWSNAGHSVFGAEEVDQ